MIGCKSGCPFGEVAAARFGLDGRRRAFRWMSRSVRNALAAGRPAAEIEREMALTAAVEDKADYPGHPGKQGA
jgi:hypothetical protein